MARVFKINDIVIPSPNINPVVNLENIHDKDSGRILNGDMDLKVINRKNTIELSWTALPDSLSSILLQAVGSSDYVYLTYPDPKTGTDQTKYMYLGTPKCTLISVVNDVCYWNINFNLIEK